MVTKNKANSRSLNFHYSNSKMAIYILQWQLTVVSCILYAINF